MLSTYALCTYLYVCYTPHSPTPKFKQFYSTYSSDFRVVFVWVLTLVGTKLEFAHTSEVGLPITLGTRSALAQHVFQYHQE